MQLNSVTDVVIFLVYTMALLIVFVFPAIRLTEKLGKKSTFIDEHSNTIAVLLSVILSLSVSFLIY